MRDAMEAWVQASKDAMLTEAKERIRRAAEVTVENCPASVRHLLASAVDGKPTSPPYDPHSHESVEDCLERLLAPLADLEAGQTFSIGGDSPHLVAVEEGTRHTRPHRMIAAGAAQWSD